MNHQWLTFKIFCTGNCVSATTTFQRIPLPCLIFAIASSEHFEAPSPPTSGDWYVLRVNGITIINAEIMKSVDAAISIFHVVIQNEGIYRFLYVSIKPPFKLNSYLENLNEFCMRLQLTSLISFMIF